MWVPSLFAAVGYFTAVVGAGFLLIRIGFWMGSLRYSLAASRLKKSQDESLFTPNYTKREIKEALQTYIRSDCGQADPSHESDFRHIADIREPIFSALDRFLSHSERRRHLLVLADSGMGKTSLCLNYFSYLRANSNFVALISLSRPNADKHIRAISNKNETILLLDALDEDAKALKGVEDRLYDLLSRAADFRSVIVTCRSQFFRDAHSIPRDTGVSVISPRRRSEGGTYTLHHLYLMPFSERQIDKFLRKQFPIWNPRSLRMRRKALSLIEKVPELSGRPMLLELVPELIRTDAMVTELFDLYTYMVDMWLKREERWISSDRLQMISMELAIEIHTLSSKGQGDRISRDRLNELATHLGYQADEWAHLSTRSLLNRDNDGLIKFAHRSVMEYFFVLAAVHGDMRCFQIRWTDVMRDLLVSWGYTNSGMSNIEMARKLLGSDLSKTSLVPLSDPPASPGFITPIDFSRAAGRRSSRSGARRVVSKHWRADSMRIVEDTDGLHVVDVECDLEWLLPYSGGAMDSETRAVFQLTIPQQLKMQDSSAYRSPSYEEFVTLVEGMEAKGIIDRFPLRELFLIGDNIGDKTHLVVEVFSDKPRFGRLKAVDSSRIIFGSEFRLSVYEMSIFADVELLHSIKVLPLFVRCLED